MADSRAERRSDSLPASLEDSPKLPGRDSPVPLRRRGSQCQVELDSRTRPGEHSHRPAEHSHHPAEHSRHPAEHSRHPDTEVTRPHKVREGDPDTVFLAHARAWLRPVYDDSRGQALEIVDRPARRVAGCRLRGPSVAQECERRFVGSPAGHVGPVGPGSSQCCARCLGPFEQVAASWDCA